MKTSEVNTSEQEKIQVLKEDVFVLKQQLD
ncbi:MAG: hypothetical protein ACI89T_001604 [Cognaticolwellia sp.]|jgi:hypothetical protein